MDKLTFITKIEDLKKRLPKAVIPSFIMRFPEYNTVKKKSRVQNVLSGRVQDEDILNKLEILSNLLNPEKN